MVVVGVPFIGGVVAVVSSGELSVVGRYVSPSTSALRLPRRSHTFRFFQKRIVTYAYFSIARIPPTNSLLTDGGATLLFLASLSTSWTSAVFSSSCMPETGRFVSWCVGVFVIQHCAYAWLSTACRDR